MKSKRYVFPPFAVDTREGSVHRDSQEIGLRAKTFAVLCYLLERPGQLVSKNELLENVWAGTYVTESALTVCIAELRKALDDDTKKPRFIATVTKRGYRFIAPLTTPSPLGSGGWGQGSVSPAQSTPDLRPPTPAFVGRDHDLVHLHNLFAKACTGQRQLVFVTGEPGVGKTSLVEAFLFGVRSRKEFGVGSLGAFGGQKTNPQALNSELPPTPNSELFSTSAPHPQPPGPKIARGQCIEHFGAGEAYLPILDALGQLCRGEGGEKVVELLGHHAPTWLGQMPELLSATDMEALQRRVMGATRERMLREITGALEVLTTEHPLVFVLEDLHWSDYSTLDFLSFIARRQSPARLMLIGTYRPGDVLQQEHPLQAVKQELQLHGQCEELSLQYLTSAQVEEYLAARFSNDTLPAQLGAVMHERTGGNPLFMINVVNDLVEQGIITQRGGQWELAGKVEDSEVPLGLRQFIEQQIARLNAKERAVLDAASVVGMDFSIAAVAAALGEEIAPVETCCEALARRSQFVQATGVSSWPDGTVGARYRFLHMLYQEVIEEGLSAGRQQRLHQQIGERIERAYGERAREIAATLAVHFERGRDYWRAVRYLQYAGESAARRSAHHEAISHFTKSLSLLKMLPDTPERAQQELTLQIALGGALMAIKGFSAPEVSQICSRARELCRQVGNSPQLFLVLGELGGVHLIRGELQIARELAEELMRLAQSLQRPARLQAAYHFLGQVRYALGEFIQARADLEQAMTLYDPQRRRVPTLYDSGVASLSIAAFTLWALGYPAQARTKMEEALALAQDHPFSLSYALLCVALLHQSRREGSATYEQAEALITLAREQGFALREAEGTVLQGWALAEQGKGEEGIAQLRQGLATTRAMGAELYTPHFLGLLAEAYGTVGQAEEGLTALAEAFAVTDKTGERHYEAELYRLQGELTRQEASQRSKVKSQKSKIGIRNWELEADSSSPQASSLKPLAPSGVAREAEEYFLKAIAIAQQQQAKSLELRAVMSLVRLRQHQTQEHATPSTQPASRSALAEAHGMLSALYAWFTEGFDTRDLQEAKALLDALAQESGAEIPAPEITQQETPVPNLRLVVNK